jgi:hypothetical protein
MSRKAAHGALAMRVQEGYEDMDASRESGRGQVGLCRASCMMVGRRCACRLAVEV